jgi:beta-N-acetylhexosaminidase
MHLMPVLITSYELNQLGINLLLAPVLDVNNNPENPVINTRSFGMTLDAGDLAISYERGARLGGAIPVIKHFPGHGDTNVDSHLGLPVIEKTEAELLDFRIDSLSKINTRRCKGCDECSYHLSQSR